VAATFLDVPCFRYQSKDLSARVCVEAGSGGGQLVHCPIRQGNYVLTPEEHVRQALIWFLTQGAQSASAWGERLLWLVERSSLDVSAYHLPKSVESRFAPPLPVVIFETKRIERDSDNDAATDAQLQGYMVRERCRSGFIFNGRQAAWLSLGGEFIAPFWEKTAITDLSEAESRITHAADVVSKYASECEIAFALAAGGNFDAFVTIVAAFGSNAGLTFSLSVRTGGGIGPARAFSLKVTAPGVVTYRVRGAGVKHRLELTKEGFHGLRAIEPLA
jgi:hypothetical protein